MKRIKGLIAFLMLLASASTLMAQKPRWVGNTPKETNSTYKFVEIVASGANISAARENTLSTLAQDEQLAHAVEVSVNTGALTKISQTQENGRINEIVEDNMTIDVKMNGGTYRLQSQKVDEYVEGERYGEVVLHTLYMVALCDKPRFDKVRLSTSYGAAPVFMSIIPGVGQWYKGSKVKGACMLASEAVAVAGIILCDNQRASYNKKAIEQPKFAKQYSSKASNWETGRNICIGVAAGLWVYNIVDAAVAKGCRRVIVKRADGGGLSLAPFGHPQGAGLSLAYRF